MSTLFSSSSESASGKSVEATTVDAEHVDRVAPRGIDSNAVRWVLAVTIAFWLTLYAARSSLF